MHGSRSVWSALVGLSWHAASGRGWLKRCKVSGTLQDEYSSAEDSAGEEEPLLAAAEDEEPAAADEPVSEAAPEPAILLVTQRVRARCIAQGSALRPSPIALILYAEVGIACMQ